MLQQDLTHLTKLPVAALRAWVVQRDHEVSQSRGPHTILYHLPRGKQVREAYRAMVMPQRRAEQRSSRLRRRDAWDHDHLNVLPGQLQRGRGHCVDANIAARNERAAPAGTGLGEGFLGTLDLVTQRQREHSCPRSQEMADPLDVLLEPHDEIRGSKRIA